MGLQIATLGRVGASSVYTTHLTGNLTRLGREGAHSLVYLRERGAGDEQGRRSLRRVALMALLWLAYLVGALAGSAAADAWQGRAAAFAVVVLLGLVIVDVVRPIGGHEPPEEPHPMF
jgi:uncharacterized membrane protein YoaK (UPF0700 family)